MFNAPLLLETALLILAAFVIGAVLGSLARMLLARPRAVAADARPVDAESTASAPAPTSALVTAPEIRPLARPSVADRIAAAAEGKSAAVPSVPEPPLVPAALPPDASLAAPLAPLPVAAVAAEPDVADTPLPVEQRDEPTLAPDDLVVTDAPQDLPAVLENTHALAEPAPAPAVVPEAPLVEPEAEREAAITNESLLDRADEEARLLADLATERSAMQAIESGWTPRPAAQPRAAADLPEGVSPAELAAADRAVEEAAVAVASAKARVTSALLEIAGAPAPPVPPSTAEPPPETDLAIAGRAPRSGGFGRPQALEAPRDGVRDDLSLIRGLTPAIASALNGLGIYHYDQVADWDQKAVVWLENHFGFKGRIGRERWQQQARDLAKGRPATAARTASTRPVRR